MKKQKNFWIIFIIPFMSFVLIFANACLDKPEKIQMEIKAVTDGMAITQGKLLFVRMYDNRKIEFDTVRKEGAPLSESNVVRNKMVLSEQDAKEIQSILVEIENSDLKKFYPAPLSDPPTLDVVRYTEVIFADRNGENKSIVIQLEINRLTGSEYEQMYPRPLIKLLKKAASIRFLSS